MTHELEILIVQSSWHGECYRLFSFHQSLTGPEILAVKNIKSCTFATLDGWPSTLDGSPGQNVSRNRRTLIFIETYFPFTQELENWVGNRTWLGGCYRLFNIHESEVWNEIFAVKHRSSCHSLSLDATSWYDLKVFYWLRALFKSFFLTKLFNGLTVYERHHYVASHIFYLYLIFQFVFVQYIFLLYINSLGL